MSERTSSPEARLLRLIRHQPSEEPSAPGATRSPAAARPPRRLTWPRWPSSAVLMMLNVMLGICLLGVLGGIAWLLMRPAQLPAVSSSAKPVELPSPPPPPPALDTQLFQQRQLFHSPRDAAAPEPTGPSQADLQKQAQAATATLTLMGVMDGNPSQAIIADSQTQRSYFVKEGETFGAGIRVEKVADGRVILNYQGIQVELHL